MHPGVTYWRSSPPLAVCDRQGKPGCDVVADRGYFKIEDIEACEKAGLTPHVPKPSADRPCDPDCQFASNRDPFFASNRDPC